VEVGISVNVLTGAVHVERVVLIQAILEREDVVGHLAVVEAALAVVVPLDEQPRHGVARGDKVLEQPVERVLAAENVAVANIVAREDERVGVLRRDERAEKGRRVGVRARVLLLRGGNVLAGKVVREMNIAYLDKLERAAAGLGA
jgi:hypothetical protein